MQIQACGVCHTDLHYREGGINDDFPFLLGHEAAGVVESVGDGVTDVAPGDYVILNWRAVCGNCRACRRGRAVVLLRHPQRDAEDDPRRRHRAVTRARHRSVRRQDARRRRAVHEGRPRGAGDGRRAARVRRDGRPRRGDQHRRRDPGQDVAVFGCGGVGDAAIAGARLAGASTIVAVDIDDRKLEWAKEFGATHTVQLDPRRTRSSTSVSVTGGFGADVCIEAIGIPAVYKQAFDGARPRRHGRARRRAPARRRARAAVHRGLRPRRGAQVELVRRLPAAPRLPDADRPLPPGPARPRPLRQREIALDGVEEAFHKMERGEVLRSVVVL